MSFNMILIYIFCALYSMQGFTQPSNTSLNKNGVSTLTTIAIIDTGVDLSQSYIANVVQKGVNLVAERNLPNDDNGHGTNVVGIILNTLKKSPLNLDSVRIMPIKALDEKGAGNELILSKSIVYAVENGANIINMSDGIIFDSEALRNAVAYAESHNVLIVSAAGNDAGEIRYPAAYSTVLAVGGSISDSDVRIHPKSNKGNELDVVAPWSFETIDLGGKVVEKLGTSMSSAYITATAAVLANKYQDAKTYQIRNMIRQLTRDINNKGWDRSSGYGLVRDEQIEYADPNKDMYEMMDNTEKAFPIGLGKQIEASLGLDDFSDTFQLEISEDGVLNLLFEYDNEAIFRNIIIESEDLNLKKQLITKLGDIPVHKGRYTFKVKLPENSFELPRTSYRLTPIFHIKGETIRNDIKEYATKLELHDEVVGSFDTSSDEDWYYVEINEPGSLLIEASVKSSRIDLQCNIYKDGYLSEALDQGGGGDAETSLIKTLPGKVYIRITNAFKSTPSEIYLLSIKFTNEVQPN